METQPNTIETNSALNSATVLTGELPAAFIDSIELKDFFRRFRMTNLEELFTKLTIPSGKKSFLVFKNNKYINVLTENIALFCVKYDSSVITCFDGREYFIKHSLEHIQKLVCDKQFFRLNRQCLINFNAVKEVEHYFARKLLVNPLIPVKDKLLVRKEKYPIFLIGSITVNCCKYSLKTDGCQESVVGNNLRFLCVLRVSFVFFVILVSAGIFLDHKEHKGDTKNTNFAMDL